jgi:8-oxo-dGTP pyrophosphatase MutT (NUDIX family)
VSDAPNPADFAALLTRDLWARVMAGEPTKVRPKRAATLIVVDSLTASVPKVLMGRRHDGHRFMPGKYVFPGGRVEASDRFMNVAGMLDPITEDKLMRCLPRPSPGLARALALSAIRETFEETGLLVGSREFGAPDQAPAGIWRRFADEGVYPVLEDLHLVGRAITPPRNKMRFDAVFFAVDIAAVAGRVEGIVGPDAELVDLVWVDLPSAHDLGLPLITSVILHELERRLAGGMSRFLPVPFYRTSAKGWVRDEI